MESYVQVVIPGEIPEYRPPTVDDFNIEAAVRAMDTWTRPGWTCEAHEPGIGCKVCAKVQPIAVKAILAAALEDK